MKAEGRMRRLEIGLVLGGIALYLLAASLVSLNRYWQYNAFWYDFGILDTTIWKLSRFQPPIIAQLNPPLGKIRWADHFDPSLVLIAPLYWLTARPEIMLIAQAVFAGSSAVVAYIMALKFIKSRIVRVSLIVSYLGFVGLQNALYTDMHSIVFALFPFMLTLWALFEKRWRLYWLFLIITIGFQENMAAVILMLGVFLLLRKDKNVKVGIATILLGLLYGVLMMKVVIPFFNGGSYNYQPDTPKIWYEWFTRFILPADLKLRSIVLTFATFGFIPIGSFAVLPLIVEHYLERFVLNMAATRWDLGFHYNALLSPIMFLASLELVILFQGRKVVKKLLPIWAAITIVIVIFLHRFYLHGPLMLATMPVFYEETKNAAFLKPFIEQIPTKGLLMTQNNIAAHFTHGNTILLSQNYKLIGPDTIAIDIRSGQNANDFYPLPQEKVGALVASISADENYIKKSVTGSELIFIRREK